MGVEKGADVGEDRPAKGRGEGRAFATRPPASDSGDESVKTRERELEIAREDIVARPVDRLGVRCYSSHRKIVATGNLRGFDQGFGPVLCKLPEERVPELF